MTDTTTTSPGDTVRINVPGRSNYTGSWHGATCVVTAVTEEGIIVSLPNEDDPINDISAYFFLHGEYEVLND